LQAVLFHFSPPCYPYRHASLDDGLIKKGSPYSIAERRVPELIPVLGSQPAGDVSHKLGGAAVILAILKRTATNFTAW